MEERGSSYIIGENVDWYSDWKTVWKFLKKLRIELPYDPAIPLLGIYPKNMKILIWSDICIATYLHDHHSISYSIQDMETTQVPINR